jgi:alpha-L-fucosidase
MTILLSLCATAVLAQSTLDSLQRAYVNLRFGMFICYGIETYNGGDYWDNPKPPAATVWKQSALNCKQWADAAKSAKMTYGLLTVKHHYGFCLWNTTTTTYNCMNEGTDRVDVVQAYCDAFRADSLLPGLYYSVFDVNDSVDGSYGSYSPALWNKKKGYIEQQLRELLTNYGPIPVLVTDGWAWRMGHNAIPYQEIREFVKSIQPNCLMSDHDGVGQPWDNDLIMYEEPKGEYAPAGNTYASSQGDIIMTGQPSGSWFWTGGATGYMSVSNILTHLGNLEPRYCNFLLNCPPTSSGVIDPHIVDTLAAVGAAWSPNLNRAPLPTQPHHVEHPVTPVAAKTGSGASGWNAIDGYNDRNSVTSIAQTILTISAAPPQTVTVDLGAVYTNLQILGYLPRQDYTGTAHTMTGNITSYTISIGMDTTNFTQVDSGSWSGDSSLKIAEWSPATTGRYVRLKALATVGNASVVINELEFGGRLLEPSVATGVAGRPSPLQARRTGRQCFTTVTGAVRPSSAGAVPLSVFDLSGRLVKKIDNSPAGLDSRANLGGASQLYIIKTDKP